MILQSARLVLRPLAPDDVDELVALHTDPVVTRFVRRLDRDQATQRLAEAQLDWRERGYGLFAVLDRSDHRFVGRVGLKYWPQFEETEVGWVLRREVWGRGYATEAARACVDWGFRSLRLPYLTAMIHPDNAASIRVAGRLGMSPQRRDVLEAVAVEVYVLTRRQWSLEPGTSAPHASPHERPR